MPPVLRLADGSLYGHWLRKSGPDTYAYDVRLAATWIEFADGRAQFRMRRITLTGERSPAVTVSALAAGRTSGYPRMARSGDELIFAWTEAGTPSKVTTARVRVPKMATSSIALDFAPASR